MLLQEDIILSEKILDAYIITPMVETVTAIVTGKSLPRREEWNTHVHISHKI